MDSSHVSSIDEAANAAEHWLLDKAFPFWAKHTASAEGGFYERHELTGEGIPHEDSRVRLQARQTYCFALAAGLGWDTELSRSLVERGLDVLIQDCRRLDGLYGTRVKPGQGLTQDAVETYDCAFALLAFATAWHYLKINKALDAGTDLIKVIESHLKHTSLKSEDESGYKERLPPPSRREQNPHMHLCEASLAWFEATGDVDSLNRARGLVSFVEGNFWDDDAQVLKEFDLDSPENHIEIGHLYEWVWILHRLQRLSGDALHPLANKLYASALRLSAQTHYLPLSSYCDGRVKDPRQRTWGLTEALKAHIAMADYDGRDTALERITETTRALFTDHLNDAVDGAWIDVRSAKGDALVDDITPATGYHIFTAFADLMAFQPR